LKNLFSAESQHKFRQFARHNPHWIICLIVIIIFSLYWGIWASNRYVSQSEIAVVSLKSSTHGSNLSVSEEDMLGLKGYLTSVDMLQRLVKEANFIEEYSQHGDFFSRLSRNNPPIEQVYAYYQKRITASLDVNSGTIKISAQAYTPQEAAKIGHLLLDDGQQWLNDTSQQIAKGQEDFLRKQADIAKQQYQQDQQQLVNYQNSHNLPSPTGEVQNVGTVIASLQSRLAILEARRTALLHYQSQRAPEVISINGEIEALQRQIDDEQDKVARQKGGALNEVSTQYQSLLLQANFAQQAYTGILDALERVRIEAQQQSRQIITIQKPTYPEYPEQPKRIYNITMSIVICVFIALIMNMLILIIRDHKD